MIKASIGQLQHHLSKYMVRVARGEEVFITRWNKVVAKIVPTTQGIDEEKSFPDFAKRAQSIVTKPKGKSASELVLEQRNREK